MTTESLSSALRPTFTSVAEVAHDLQVTERFVRHLIATGELRAVKVGSRLVGRPALRAGRLGRGRDPRPDDARRARPKSPPFAGVREHPHNPLTGTNARWRTQADAGEPLPGP